MKHATLILFFAISSAVIIVASFGKVKGTTLEAKEVETRWASIVFEPQAFKNGSLEIRAQMAASLLRNKNDFTG